VHHRPVGADAGGEHQPDPRPQRLAHPVGRRSV
jgi:hypothetical protein